jgi:Zn-dependent M16 (insulinase) family peptidase
MSAREHTEPDMLDRELRGALLGGSALAFEAGGLCDAIRRLSPQEIQSYHRRMYCGANVSVVVGGSIEIPDNVFLDAIQPLLAEYSSTAGFDRGAPAWPKELVVESLKPSEKRMVEFPCVDASMGTVAIGWRLLSCRESYHLLAVTVILEWLCDFDSSPLPQKFVMTESPLASDVHHEIETYLDVSTVCLMLEGVGHMDEDDDEDSAGSVAGRNDGNSDVSDEGMFASGESVSEGEDAVESILASGTVGTTVVDFLRSMLGSDILPGGLKSVHAAIVRHAEEHLADIESDAPNVVPNGILDELIYGERRPASIGTGIREYLVLLSRLQEEPISFWQQLIGQVFVQSPRVEIYMIPSPALAESLASKAKGDVESRAGESQVDAAMADPLTISEACLPPRPSTERVSRIPYAVSSSSPGAFFAQQVTVDSGLVHGTLVFSTRGLSFSQRAVLPILSDMLLSMDLKLDDGTNMPYTASSRAISEATVGTEMSGAWLGKLTSMGCDGIGVNFATTAERFEEASGLVLRALFNGLVTGPRLSSVAKNLESDAVESMRDAHNVRAAAAAVLPRLHSGSMTEQNVSNSELSSLFGRLPLLEFVAEEYSRPKGRSRVRRKLLQLLNSTLKALIEQPANGIFVQVGARNPGAGLEKFDLQWAQLWRPELVPGSESHSPMLFHATSSLESLLGEERELSRCLAVRGTDTSYLSVCVTCAVSQVHNDWSSLQVLTEMLSRTEGALYNAVRGEGLAYGISLTQNQWQSKLVLSVNEASQPAEAWNAACSALSAFRLSLEAGHGGEDLQTELNTAKSALLYGMVESRSTPSLIVSSALAGHVLSTEMGPIADRTNEEAIELVDIHSIRNSFDRYVAQLLFPGARLATLTCSPAKIEHVVKAFAESSLVPLTFEVIDTEACELPPVLELLRQMSK